MRCVPATIPCILLGCLTCHPPDACALEIEDVTGVWQIHSAWVFGHAMAGAARNRCTIAVANGAPVCLVQVEQIDTASVTFAAWESQGADQATVRITQLVPAGEVAAYAVERVDEREVRLTATTGSNTGQVVRLVKPASSRPRPLPPGAGAGGGQDPAAVRSPAEEARRGLIARLNSDMALEYKKLATARVNLSNQLEHSEGAAGGRRAEYEAVVKERQAAVQLHRTRIEDIHRKLQELGVEVVETDKDRLWRR